MAASKTAVPVFNGRTDKLVYEKLGYFNPKPDEEV